MEGLMNGINVNNMNKILKTLSYIQNIFSTKLSKINKKLEQQGLMEGYELQKNSEMLNNMHAIKEAEEIKQYYRTMRSVSEIKRQSIIDRRDNWISRLFWSLIVPLLVSILASYFILLQSNSLHYHEKSNNYNNDEIAIYNLKSRQDITEIELKFLVDIYSYEYEDESFLLNTYRDHPTTFCPNRNDANNVYQIATEKINKIEEKYLYGISSEFISEIIKIKKATLESIEYNCSKFY